MKRLLMLTLFISLLACESPVTFNEPQPAGKSSLTKFPKGLTGEYFDPINNSVYPDFEIIKITDKLMLSINNRYIKTHINDFKKDSSFWDKRVEQSIFKREEDSIVVRIHFVDTIFSISEKNILKKFKGYYFLNYSKDKAGWEVKKLEISKGELMYSLINKKEELDNLREISESAVDTMPYKFKPSKSQFKKFIRENGFKNTKRYIKIK